MNANSALSNLPCKDLCCYLILGGFDGAYLPVNGANRRLCDLPHCRKIGLVDARDGKKSQVPNLFLCLSQGYSALASKLSLEEQQLLGSEPEICVSGESNDQLAAFDGDLSQR